MNFSKSGTIMNSKDKAISPEIPGMIERLGRNYSTFNQEPDPENMKTEIIFSKVSVRPNPFSTSVTLEVTSSQNQQVIVRMSNEEGQIVKLFGWYLLKGTNVTTMTELNSFYSGTYSIAILGGDGELFFNTEISKA